MRNSGRSLTATLLLLLLAAGVSYAQSDSNARAVFNEALKREATLRAELQADPPPVSPAPLLQRIRTLVGAYADMSRLFPAGGQSDRALWQGALLSADAFWHFGEELDRTSALGLLAALATRFPDSPLNEDSAPHVQRLTDAYAEPPPSIRSDDDELSPVDVEPRLSPVFRDEGGGPAVDATGPDATRTGAAVREASAADAPVAAPLPADPAPPGSVAPGAAVPAPEPVGDARPVELPLEERLPRPAIARIAIDPGHGGQDHGVRAHGLTEADIVLDVALRLERLLREEPGVEVVLTRGTDTHVSIEDRMAAASRAGADLFLSLHLNAHANASTRGVETYVLGASLDAASEAVASRENAGAAASPRVPGLGRVIALSDTPDESRTLARLVQTSLFERLNRYDRHVRNLGVKQGPLVVLAGAPMPGVVVQMAFLTNADAARLLRTPAYRQQIAEGLFTGISGFRQTERAGAAGSR